MFKKFIMKKIIIIILVVFLVVATGLYFYAYKGHRDIASEKADYTLTLSQLQNDFKSNDSLFNAKYADKTIEIYGKITAIDLPNHAIMLDEKISVTFEDSVMADFKILDVKYIKGRYVGFDDLLEEFKFDQAIVVQK